MLCQVIRDLWPVLVLHDGLIHRRSGRGFRCAYHGVPVRDRLGDIRDCCSPCIRDGLLVLRACASHAFDRLLCLHLEDVEPHALPIDGGGEALVIPKRFALQGLRLHFLQERVELARYRVGAFALLVHPSRDLVDSLFERTPLGFRFLVVGLRRFRLFRRFRFRRNVYDLAFDNFRRYRFQLDDFRLVLIHYSSSL